MTTKTLALFSGGLDSILACRVVAKQGINVQAIKFISPFFDFHLLGSDYPERVKEKYDINVKLVDISQAYMKLLRSPAHGYGKHFNPCLDCKIFMMGRAREMMEEEGASFLISGEVVGQRPMSQRRDALRLVERESGCQGLLVRPLCAKNLDPTDVELKGLIDRDQLCNFNGRTRKPQIALAKEFGITDYPTPAGGCVLTDPVVGERIKQFYADHDDIKSSDMQMIMVGRQFCLPSGAWLVMGREESENEAVKDIFQKGDILLKLPDRPGPTAVLRYKQSENDLTLAAGLVARYAKKNTEGKPYPGMVSCVSENCEASIEGIPPAEEDIKSWLR